MDEKTVLFNQLFDCLKIQSEIIDRLIAAGETQREALRQNDLDGLSKTVREQEICASEMEKAERRRLSIQASIEKAFIIDKSMTLSGLTPLSPEPVRVSLQKTHNSLREKVKKIKEINSFNNILIKKAMMINNRLFQISNAGKLTTYGTKGLIEGMKQGASVLNRSV